MCTQCDFLRDGATIYSTCLKYEGGGKDRVGICRGNGASCGSDYVKCPLTGSFGSSSKKCKDKKGKWRKKKCEKKSKKGHCDLKNKVRKKCKKTCSFYMNIDLCSA